MKADFETNKNGETKQLTYLGVEKTAIATMDGDALSKFVSRWVNKALKDSEEVDENGKPTKTALAAIEQIEGYMEEQMAMFASKGLKRETAYSSAIVPTGEVFVNRLGDRVEKFRIVKRGQSLEPVFEDVDGDHGASVRASLKLPSETRMAREARRGKYNDGGLTIEQSACSVDRSEWYGGL